MSASYQFTSPWTEPYQNAPSDSHDFGKERDTAGRPTAEALDTIYNHPYERDMDDRIPGSAGHMM